MSISSKLLFSGFHQAKESYNAQKSALQMAQTDSDLAQEVKQKIHLAYSDNQSINWQNHPNRVLLEKLYKKSDFKDLYPHFSFKDAKELQPFMQRLEIHLEKCEKELRLSHDICQSKHSEMMQMHSELLQIIRTLGQCISQFLR